MDKLDYTYIVFGLWQISWYKWRGDMFPFTKTAVPLVVFGPSFMKCRSSLVQM